MDTSSLHLESPSSEHAIAVTVGANYFDVLCLFLDTLEQNYPAHPNVVVCYRNFSLGQTRFLKQRYARLRLLDIDGYPLPTGPGMLHHDRLYDLDVFYARLLLWTDVFDDYQVVLYLDVDLLVLAPLDGLFETSSFSIIAESYRGAHPVLYDNQQDEWQPLLKEDGIAECSDQQPANAGVFAIARRYRTHAQFQRLASILERYEPYLAWGDQSMLNIWMWQNGLEPSYDFRYNFQARLLEQRRERKAYRDARILHFNGMSTTGLVAHVMQMAIMLWVIPGIGHKLFAGYYRMLRHPYGEKIARHGWAAFIDWVYWRFQDYNPHAVSATPPEAEPAMYDS